MPLKYRRGRPLAVKYAGWAHGVLFTAHGALVLLAMLRAALPFWPRSGVLLQPLIDCECRTVGVLG